MMNALENVDDCCPETLPSELRMRCGLCERNFALRQIHFPESSDALRRLARRDMSFVPESFAARV